MNTENKNRVETLYKRHYKCLLNYSNNITKNTEISEELLSQLFLFLLEKPNEKLYYSDSFNLCYCQRFIFSKFINYINEKNKFIELDYNTEVIEEEYYDFNKDLKTEELTQAYISIINELKNRNKYSPSYIKHKLYGLSVKNCAKQMRCHINSIYCNFRILDDQVNEKFELKKLELEEKYKEYEE